jgi:hypoxanthine-guanine phosphoribosyltransferase
MDKLVRFKTSANAVAYEIEPHKKIKRYIVSTPFTRKILNQPEIFGFEFIENLRNGVYEMLKLLSHFQSYGDKNVSVLHFLRGGLNFGLLNNLYKAYGFNRTYASFVTSQRYRKHENWFIKDDQYKKFALPEDATIFVGDVIATGTTLDNGLEILRQQCLSEGKNIRRLVMITIGCGRAEEIVSKYHDIFRKNFDYDETIIVYFEGRFRLPDADEGLSIFIPGTDLIKKVALLTPEFHKSQDENITYPLERCVVYDVGARAYQYAQHLDDVIDYWKRLSHSGLTLKEAYDERWYAKGKDIPDSNQALQKLCNARIRFLRELKNGK